MSEVSVAAKASCKACSDFIVERKVGIDCVKPPHLAAIREEQLKLQGRIQECYKVVVSATISAKVMIDKAIRKTQAEKVFEKRASAFDKYNSRKDQVFTADDIVLYAKGEFSFVLSKESAANIVKKFGDGKSVPRARFQRIKVAVGIAREEDASRLRREEAERKRLALEAKKKAIEVGQFRLVRLIGRPTKRTKKDPGLAPNLEGFSQERHARRAFLERGRAYFRR